MTVKLIKRKWDMLGKRLKNKIVIRDKINVIEVYIQKTCYRGEK